jgi:uncharacterized protein
MSDKATERTSFNEFCELLMPLGALISPAELHGILCGKLGGGARPTEVEWLLEAVEYLDFSQAPDTSVRQALSQLYQDTIAQLRGDSFALTLLLPDDDTPLEERIRCLSQWCQGFLTGFGSAGIPGRSPLSEESEEALSDLASIVRIDEDVDDDSSEEDFMEIVEYVRMAAVALYMEYAGRAEVESTGQDARPPTLH